MLPISKHVMKTKKPIQYFFAHAIICSNVMGGGLLHKTNTENPAAPKLPDRTAITKQGLIQYFLKLLPGNFADNLSEMAGMGDMPFLLNKAETDPKHSPFRIFNFAQDRRLAYKPWSLSFENHGDDGQLFKDLVQEDFGLCAGVTYLTRRMNMLAIYDMDNAEKQIIPNRQVDPEGWLTFMKEKIDDIVDLKMAIIPGYKDLKSFSTDPEIKQYMKEKVIQIWKEVNVNLVQGTLQGLGTSNKPNMSPEEMEEFYDKVKERLDAGYNPIMYMAQNTDNYNAENDAEILAEMKYLAEEEGKNPDEVVYKGEKKSFFTKDRWIHTVQISGIGPKNADGSYSVQIWDVNYPNAEARKTFTIKSNGIATYTGMKLTSFHVLKWDDLEVARMIETNLKFCINHPKLCTQKP